MILLSIYLLVTYILWPVLVWIFIFLMNLLQWILVGVIANLCFWLISSAVLLTPLFLFVPFCKWAHDQLINSEQGRYSGTSLYVLFLIPIGVFVGLPLVAFGAFLWGITTFFCLFTLIPFYDWGNKDLSLFDDYWNEMSDSVLLNGDAALTTLIFDANILIPFSILLSIASSYIIFQQAKAVDIGETSKYGAVGFGIALIPALIPVIQMFFWESHTESLSSSVISKTRNLHIFSCILSLLISTMAMSKLVAFQQNKLNQEELIKNPYAIEIQNFYPGVYFKHILFGLSLSVMSYIFWLPITGDPLNGDGISKLSTSISTLYSIGGALLVMVISTLFLIRNQYANSGERLNG